MSLIAISRVHFPVTTLGPGRRIGIWMQGCSIRCPGCISADTWAEGRGQISLSEIFAILKPWLKTADGITISGGEPFDQAAALGELLLGLRQRTQADILVYSGYPKETIDHFLANMEGLIDALISDPYQVEAPQTLALRGSDNQRLYCLTPLGFMKFKAFQDDRSGAGALDVMFDDDGTVWFTGIPSRGAWRDLQQQLEKMGHSVNTTDDCSIAAGGTKRG